MAMYPGTPTIRTEIKKGKDGQYYTYVWKDGTVIRTVPTTDSQIRKERKSLLYVPPVGCLALKIHGHKKYGKYLPKI